MDNANLHKSIKKVESAVRYCHKRHPESLDQIFDNLPVKLNQQVLDGTVAALKKDIDSLSWLCSYFASEINSTEDNQKPRHFIAEQQIAHDIRDGTQYCSGFAFSTWN